MRLIRSTSGSRGSQQGGRYVIEDPRTVFSPAQDRQVVVYFEWEGRPGNHRCEAQWKDPSGKVVLSSPIDYAAPSRRFGIYWSLTLSENVATGLWAVETTVDGQPAGTHTFQISAEGGTATSTRRALPPAELYKRGLSAVATVEALGPAGEPIARGPAVALDADHLLTSFPTVEGAASLRVRGPDGRTAEARALSGFDRRRGWALVSLPAHGVALLPRSAAAPTVGDRYSVLQTTSDGSRILVDAAVVGLEEPPSPRSRLNAPFAAGAPLLDEYGEMAGVVVRGPSEEPLGAILMSLHDRADVRDADGSLLLPAASLPEKPSEPVPLAQLAAQGAFVRPLSLLRRNIISGVFATKIERGAAAPVVQDQRSTFSRREGQAAVFLQWLPVEKRDGMGAFEVYDADYRKVGQSDPVKMKLRPREMLFSGWTFNIARMPPAVYRVDFMLDGEPAWRGYVKITE